MLDVKPETLPYWIRVMVANTQATTGGFTGAPLLQFWTNSKGSVEGHLGEFGTISEKCVEMRRVFGEMSGTVGQIVWKSGVFL